MHEYNVTNEVVHQILHSCEDNNIKNPKKISVEIGELTTYKKDSVLFYFNGLKKDKEMLKNANLEIIMVKGKISCNKCLKTSIVQPSPILICPKCSSFDILITQGNDIKIKNII